MTESEEWKESEGLEELQKSRESENWEEGLECNEAECRSNSH